MIPLLVFAGRRQKACAAMERDGYALLETVNMNAAFYICAVET